MGIDTLIAHIQRIINLDQDAQSALRAVLHPKKVRKRQYLLHEGDVCRHYYFVLQGCLRMFMVDEKGTEHVIQFATEDWWISDIGSFHEERPSHFFIEALEASKVLQLSKSDLISLYVQHSMFDRYFRVLVENAFVKTQHRIIQNISSTAEERYQYFLKHYSHLSQRIPQSQIASFIGVTPEFLSTIRNRLRTK